MSEADAESLVTVGGKKLKKRLTVAERQKRRRSQKMIGGGVFGVLSLILALGLQPLRATIDYGICRTLAELKSANPSTMKVISYENYGSAWKIFYTFIGSYGEQRSNFIDCVFTIDAEGKKILREAKINRKSIDQADLDVFNLSIPAIIAANPNLEIPPPLEESDLLGLQR
jgi:hypothetical protein